MIVILPTVVYQLRGCPPPPPSPPNLYWFSLNRRPSVGAEHTLAIGRDLVHFLRDGGYYEWEWEKGGGFPPPWGIRSTRPVIPGELDASRARVRFAGRVDYAHAAAVLPSRS